LCLQKSYNFVLTYMVKKLSCAFIATFVILLTQVGNAQDPIFSQFYANPLYLNPALAGSAICPRLNLNYRNQWPSIPGTYVTYSASFDQYWDKISGGVGLIAMRDQAGEGALVTNTVGAIYSYRLTVSRKHFLNAGFQATYENRSLDWDKLTFPDMIDPKYGFVNATQEKRPDHLSIGFADFSSGLTFSNADNYYVGVAFHHLTQPNEGFYSDISSRLNMKLTAHAGFILDLKRKSGKTRNQEDPTISANILYQQQQKFQQLNYGIYFNRFPFVGGMWFRQSFNNPDAIIFLAGLQQESFRVGYSYDLTVSKLTNITGGAHEISVSWIFPCPVKHKKVRAINCPTF
jgi:type IX secretion system PorP/SprF family membrane protein